MNELMNESKPNGLYCKDDRDSDTGKTGNCSDTDLRAFKAKLKNCKSEFEKDLLTYFNGIKT